MMVIMMHFSRLDSLKPICQTRWLARELTVQAVDYANTPQAGASERFFQG